MVLKVYNTLSREKEVFTPQHPPKVSMYVCGPTVYDFAHIGNARPAVMFDVFYRLLKALDFKVTYVRNVTDVDDKINKAAADRGIPIRELTETTFQAYLEDMDALKVLHPDHQPRVTDHIPDIIRMIQVLLDKGHAYAAEGHVLFATDSMPTYGALSRKELDDLIAGARVDVAPYKRSPTDFVLWKPSVGDQPGWDSPFGFGRPGWHIECSAMIEAHLGETIDLHAGGHDLIFPHHENEIAQGSCAHGGVLYSKYWMHNGMLMVNGQKMSKSLGNFFTVRDMLAHAPGEAIRFYLLKTHYRQPLNWTMEGLADAKRELDGFYNALMQEDWGHGMIVETPFGTIQEPSLAPQNLSFSEWMSLREDRSLSHDFMDALQDDLNTPLAISVLHEIAKKLNKCDNLMERAVLKDKLKRLGGLLGILGAAPRAWFHWTAAGESALDGAMIDGLLKERERARKTKNFARADEIRDQLLAMDVVIEDTSAGAIWKRK